MVADRSYRDFILNGRNYYIGYPAYYQQKPLASVSGVIPLGFCLLHSPVAYAWIGSSDA